MTAEEIAVKRIKGEWGSKRKKAEKRRRKEEEERKKYLCPNLNCRAQRILVIFVDRLWLFCPICKSADRIGKIKKKR